MNRLRFCLVAMLAAACGSTTGTPGAASAGVPSPAISSPAVTPSAAPLFTSPPLPTAGAICVPTDDGVTVYVDAKANLFGAGIDRAPGPGNGGGGGLPVLVELPATGAELVTLPCTGGLTDCCSGTPSTGPAGFNTETNVESYGGIAGLVVTDRAMFLAGVFLGPDAPAEPAPERLDLSGKLDFERLEPELRQTFFIGDGVGKTFVVPAGATRLYLGFVDAAFFVGLPGFYGNNRGGLEATVAFD